MIPDPRFNIWEQTKESLFELYARRARRELPEMTCLKQAAELLAPHIWPGMTVLDAGCGAGYFYWSLRDRGLPVEYHGLDYTASFIGIGRRYLSPDPLPPERLIWGCIEDLADRFDAVVCVNTLYCLPDYRQGLERLAEAARHLIILRTALADRTIIRYETDDYLDAGFRGPGGPRSYFNIWAHDEITAYLNDLGFDVTPIRDERTGDQPELSAGKVFPWRFFLARRRNTAPKPATGDR